MKQKIYLFLVNILLLGFIFNCEVFSQTKYDLNVNRIRLPIDNSGVLADVLVDSTEGYFDGKNFLFSGGFLLSGKVGDSIWANGVATASRIRDFKAGNVDSSELDPKYKLYVVFSSPAFNQTWLDYKTAVSIGAKFYDGNGDGVYNPVDLNANGQWDPNEDRPDVIGDVSIWCVYNDGVPKNLRRFGGDPLGIEIHQTVFAYRTNNPNDARSSTIFVRYKIINTGKVAPVLDSVYFAGWADTDNGVYNNDLAGCDTLHNAGYIYDNGYDEIWGIDPPAHFVKILQGPYAYIPGVTFVDNNSNGKYDPGVDTPLDTAYNLKGKIRGLDILPGAKNLGMSAFIGIIKHYTPVAEPQTTTEARNYLLGRNRLGQNYNPCSFEVGTVFGVDCNQVNPRFMFSGDPVTQTGWINVIPNDYRQIVSSGPFKLEVGKPVNIIISHIVGRGNNSLNSITVGREYSNAISQFYRSNFDYITLSAENADETIVKEFRLYQNYPNPFNPSTKIRWQSPVSGWQTLKIYDVLGREVATLVDEFRDAGKYEVDFNAEGLSSGIYYYRLRINDKIETKKMLLVK